MLHHNCTGPAAALSTAPAVCSLATHRARALGCLAMIVCEMHVQHLQQHMPCNPLCMMQTTSSLVPCRKRDAAHVQTLPALQRSLRVEQHMHVNDATTHHRAHKPGKVPYALGCYTSPARLTLSHGAPMHSTWLPHGCHMTHKPTPQCDVTPAAQYDQGSLVVGGT